MKHLYLIRHAKSSWQDMSSSDDKRPLNWRGKRDAPHMAKMMTSIVPHVDALVSSHAVRAYKTAKHFAKAYHIPKQAILKEKSLYHASTDDILNNIYTLEKEHKTVFLFGHNPGFTVFANRIPGVNIDNVPTCGIIGVSADIDSWENFYFDKAKLTGFHYPKQYFTIN